MPVDPIIERVRFRSDPVADPKALVVAGRARFTVLTDRLLRLEYAADGSFEDRASYAVPFRRQPVVPFTVSLDGDTTTIETAAVRLTYRDDGKPFHDGNLQLIGPGFAWRFGVPDAHNLGGGRRTVDDCRSEAALEPGLASRSGWALHDDGALAVFDADGWPSGRESGAVDLYFFGHGHDYAAAVRDLTRVSGRPPMLPRWALGAWWSRYHAYDEAELLELLNEFTDHALPLSVVVIDMDWHLPDGWTGYTWNRSLFPDPSRLLQDLHERGLRVTLNLHPAQGVQAFEQAYPQFARRHGIDPASGAPVPFDITDQAFVRDYFDLLMHPHEEEGVDFWWMDWQQGRSTAVPGLDPLPWLNHLHFADAARHRDRRPLDFSRWGGLGSHRYPVGFSGDTFAQWSALSFQPRYTAAGANAGYGWWSHDIGGHSGADTPELYVRWVQFGAVSPILRLHSNNQPDSERRPWAFDERTTRLAREAFALRYELVPYLYTAARAGLDDGAAPIRPMPWLAPEEDGAYLARRQYAFGPDLIVAPVVTPVDTSTGLADVDVWLPAGQWTERTTGMRVTGPRWVRDAVPLERVPQWVRAGAVLPVAVGATSTDAPDELTLSVFGGGSRRSQLFDDAGDGEREDGDWTELQTTSDERSTTVRVRPGRERAFVLRFEHVERPLQVTLDGASTHDWQWQDGTLRVPVGHRGTAFTVAARGDERWRRPGPPPPADPAVQVIEHTAPDEAARTLGRVIVSAPADDRPATASVRWTCQLGADTTVTDTPLTPITGQAVALDVPARWDGGRAPQRWSADVTVQYAGTRTDHHHDSRLINPTITRWERGASGIDQHGPDRWEHWQSDPTDPEYGSLADPVVVRFHDWNERGQEPAVGWARATLHLDVPGELAIAYISGSDVEVWLDDRPLRADVTGGQPARYFTVDPPARRTSSAGLAAGDHEVRVRVPRPDSGPVDWYLIAWPADPGTGDLRMDVRTS